MKLRAGAFLLALVAASLAAQATAQGQSATGSRSAAAQRAARKEFDDALYQLTSGSALTTAGGKKASPCLAVSSPDYAQKCETVIKLAPTLRPPPQIGEEARAHFIKGNTLQKLASNAEGAQAAVAEYGEALAWAPWWAEAYYNMSGALRLAGRYPEAIHALQLYLQSNPADARAVQDKLYALEAEGQNAAIEAQKKAQRDVEEAARQKAAAERAAAEERQEKTEEFLKSLHGPWQVSYCNAPGTKGCTEQERWGANWRDRANEELSFPGDGTIVVAEPGGDVRLVGTPSGNPFFFDLMGLKSVVWTCQWPNGAQTQAIVEVSRSSMLTPVFTWTCGHGPDPSRHIYWRYTKVFVSP